MRNVLRALLSFIVSLFRSRASMQLEILALRHQLAVCQQSVKRPRLKPPDRILWAWLSKIWAGWERVLLVFLILAHARRRVLRFNVTEHPTAVSLGISHRKSLILNDNGDETADWTARQIVQAFPCYERRAA